MEVAIKQSENRFQTAYTILDGQTIGPPKAYQIIHCIYYTLFFKRCSRLIKGSSQIAGEWPEAVIGNKPKS